MMDNTPQWGFFDNAYYFKSCYSGNIKFLRIKLDKENSILLWVKKILNNGMNQTLKEWKYLTLSS